MNSKSRKQARKKREALRKEIENMTLSPFETRKNKKRLPKENNKDLTNKWNIPQWANDHSEIPSHTEHTFSNSHNKKQEYQCENMKRREEEARKEIERKKKCVAPAFNKGAYTYVSSKEQAKWIGK